MLKHLSSTRKKLIFVKHVVFVARGFSDLITLVNKYGRGKNSS